MKILTIGESPYLLTRNGRITRDLILSLSDNGHYVEGIVFHHDTSYFLSSETGEHFFDHKRQRICRLHPYMDERGGLTQFSFDMMKKLQPNVVITVGEYQDTTDIWSIKATYPHLFKWIAVVPVGTSIVNEQYKEQIEYADLIITQSETGRKALRNGGINVPVEVLPYGPDLEIFQNKNEPLPETFGLLALGKNAQMTNLPAVIRAVAKNEGMEAYIHTNIDDVGENDLRLLLKRYGVEDRIGIPEQKFISVREGVPDAFLNELYNSFHAVVDCSMQSATALSVLEAMATGCIPVGIEFGAVGEVISRLPADYRFVVPYNILIGPREEEFAIVSENELSAVLNVVRDRYKASPEWFAEGRAKARQIAEIFSKDVFVTRLNTVVEGALTCEHAIVVDSL